MLGVESVRSGKCEEWRVLVSGKCEEWKVLGVESVRSGKCEGLTWPQCRY